ncbi:P44/Msp2 family outer membrane protein [Wolbachia endosymbiont of Ctenocephalides felis wCfeJ]|uniref:P44/Msp2 family outer membrane protein n=1 Tax=Wolbachia endosymbiont of Ctenocephalides felis wCfeJ TaxID=2732594 RepID=UPI00144665AD|nr:P44/Msp2 family outer membrane protein [Wolbachia endosymbiont of Ctenocephalides felis wCfeJ]WCR57790.1 MAG: hypothetical protein PG980_000262 [Wolbachia endosymbiont of Ctenocephalides felis wCfeJ]
MIRKSVVFGALLILHVSFFSAQANVGDEQFVEDLIFADESMCHKSRKYDEKEVTSVKSKRLDFYVSANSGKIYHDNSGAFVSGITAIGERCLTLVGTRYGVIVKNIVADEIESVKKFDGKVDFQWLNSISLGYYAGENGRIDFEVIYSKIDIKSGDTFLIFDRSASVFAFLFNAYYNPSIQYTKITPYISLGIGPTVFRLRKINGSPQNLMPLNVPWFAYQLKLGVDYPIIPEIKSSLGYRYLSIPIPIADDISTHSIEVGLTFNF